MNNTSNEATDSRRHLRAGPVRLTLADGELRYLRVGDKEIVRRIYFAVRDADWNTAMPTFTPPEVEDGGDHFSIRLAGHCVLGGAAPHPVDYRWIGQITGAPDGTITFRASGAPGIDFDSNRIGLCVLFGNGSLANQMFETDGSPANGTFPPLVHPKLVAEKFHRLSYKTAEGLAVSCTLEGATFDMEDQRNWGDSSWKAYAPLPYAYKHVKAGDQREQAVTIRVTGAPKATAAGEADKEPTRVKIGGAATSGARIPKITVTPRRKNAAEKPHFFADINFKRDAFANAREVTWAYTCTEHLPDDDTVMETVPTVAEQARTVHSFNLSAVLHVGPIQMDKRRSDPRLQTPLGAAWATALVKYLAEGGVEAAAFEAPPGSPTAIALEALQPFAGRALIDVQVASHFNGDITAFAISSDAPAGRSGGASLVLVNRTNHTRTVLLEGASTGEIAAVRMHGAGPQTDEKVGVEAGAAKVVLAPYEVFRTK